MIPSRLPHLLVRVLTLAVLVVSGTYLLVYLYRWEWNRALISGMFVLAAEVAYVGLSLRTEIGRLSTRIGALEASDSAAQPLRPTDLRSPAGPRGPDARPARPFAWLRESTSGQTNVFVPVLLGAGVILSAAAFVIERVAGVVTTTTVDRTAPRRLVGLEPVAHSLLETAPKPPPLDRDRRHRGGVAGALVRLVALVVLALSILAAIDLLADATQSRPSPAVSGTSTIVELRVDQRRNRPALEAAEALAVACHGTLRAGSEVTNIETVRADHVRMEVTPALSELRRRRLFGCLQDATLDLVQAHVVGWTTTPASPETDPGDAERGPKGSEAQRMSAA
jgi:hypothetical protein